MNKIDAGIRNAFCAQIGNLELPKRHITVKEDVLKAVYEVYGAKSIIARRMKGRALVRESVNPILDEIGARIYNYFNAEPDTELTENNFDAFFYNVCNYFVTEYNKLANTNRIKPVQFGIAQKLINMIFKYLSCYADYDSFADLFQFCHMPVDSYVLHYFNVNGLVGGIVSRFTPGMISPAAAYDGHGWSELTEDSYRELVREYRAALALLYPQYSSLHQEFYIWGYVQARTPERGIAFNPCAPLTGEKSGFKK